MHDAPSKGNPCYGSGCAVRSKLPLNGSPSRPSDNPPVDLEPFPQDTSSNTGTFGSDFSICLVNCGGERLFMCCFTRFLPVIRLYSESLGVTLFEFVAKVGRTVMYIVNLHEQTNVRVSG